MRITRLFAAVAAIATLGLTTPRVSAAQLADTKMLTADAVKSLLASAEATAKQNKWTVSIAITDAAGDLLGVDIGL